MWFQSKERNKNYCPGGEALGGIVASHTCTAYRWGTFLKYVFPLCKTMNLRHFYFTDPQIVHSLTAQFQLPDLAANSIRQVATDEFQKDENLLVTIPQSSTEEFNGRNCCSLFAVEDRTLLRNNMRVLALIPPPPPSKDFPGESLHKLNESNNQHKLQDSPPVRADLSSQNNIALLLPISVCLHGQRRVLQRSEL